MLFNLLYVENEFASRKAAKDAEKSEISHGHTQTHTDKKNDFLFSESIKRRFTENIVLERIVQ